jgi:hypothetical protein
MTLKYTFDVYNLTNTTSFDIPGAEVTQNAGYNPFPQAPNSSLSAPTQVLPTSCDNTNTGFYACPSGLGIVSHTIGSPRQIQMSLRLDF